MKGIMKRLLCFVLVIAMLATYAVPAHATEPAGVSFKQVDNSVVSATIPGREPVELPEEEQPYADNDVVRVSIVLERASTIEVGYSPINIAGNSSAMAYRDYLESEQYSVVNQIESVIQKDLDVVWNLTLAANIISANVEFGQIDAIEQVTGVKCVIIETRYAPDVVSTGSADPDMATSGAQIGSSAAWAAGYTGAGSKIAIIDTGADIEHEAFDSEAFDYSIEQLDADVDLADASDIAAVLGELNAYKRSKVSADALYVNTKIPFGFNYIDEDLDIVHVNDGQGEHGSHVAGIATANAYVNNGDGTFSPALQATHVQGVAPDAQMMVMKVFGKNGGAYDSDYMAAIEDAVILGADSVNLSLGSGNPGMSTVNAEYRDIMESLVQSGVVVAMSAGNSGYWSEAAENGLPYLYLDDVSMQTDGSPGSYTNAFTVASVDNDGFTSTFFDVGGNLVSYYDSPMYGNQPMTTLSGDHEYVLVDAVGQPSDFQSVGAEVLEGKIVMCYRGTTSFFEKANAAAAMGAAGVIVVNTEDESFGMNLTGYEYTVPVVSIPLSAGEVFKSVGTEHTTESGITYWTGSMVIDDSPYSGQYNSEYYTMSSFSSWGVPGSLELKPEITAPGGSIYSVAGANVTEGTLLYNDHASYEVMSGTSMASPQVAGMAAVMAQYIRETGLDEQTGLDERTLAQSLLMSTAVPMRDSNSGGNYYPVIQQGAGLANVGAATMADSYILMGSDATASWADGKVKAELGDDPAKDGAYSFSFTVNNLTDETKDLILSADVFTQDNWNYEGIDLLDTWTTNLTPSVYWTVNGRPVDADSELEDMDFNGDGNVNSADGQILLDYATGLDVTLSNEDMADLNEDGEVNSYDSYLFFNLLSRGGVTLPANGSADVTVTIALSDYDRERLASYENGAYIQAYINAQTVTTEEGVVGTAHSIPMLAFYGNWSDASMFDKGSFVEYNYGLENRPPYLLDSAFSQGKFNGLLVKYSDMNGEYWFGGNPMVTDATYMPERNAISAARGDMISKLGFSAIRNAADSYYQVVNTETGEAYVNNSVGGVDSAYYYVNGDSWKNTYNTLNTGFGPEGIPEGSAVELGLTLIPEYYIDGNGSIDWDALGEGVTFSMPMVVDNTAPVLNTVDIDNENNVLAISATDNQYISAVALYDIYGQHLYTYVGADAEQAAGDTVEFALDLAEVNGTSFLLQAYDYAMNTTTYEITTQIGEVTDALERIELDKTSVIMQKGSTDSLTATVLPVNASNRDVVWATSDEAVVSVDAEGMLTANAVGTATITAAAVADNTLTATCEVEVVDISAELNAIVWDEVGSIWFSEFTANDLPNYEKLSHDMVEEDYFTTAAVGADGTLYASTLNDSTGTGSLYTVDPTTYETAKLTDITVQGLSIFYSDLTYVPAMFGTGALLGTYGPYVIAIDPTTGEALGIIDEYDSELVGITTCYGSFDSETGEYMDAVYLIQNDGTVIQEIYYGYEGSVVPYMYYFQGERASFDAGVNVGDAWYFNSAYYDGNHLYWAAFDVKTENAVTLYAIDADYSGNVYNMGQFGEGVWPVGGMHQLNAENTVNESLLEEVKANMAGREIATADIQLVAKAFPVEETEADGSLNSFVGASDSDARPMSVGKILFNAGVTAKDADGNDVATHNGVQTITYDPDVLTLVKVEMQSDYFSVNPADIADADGSVTIGYVDLEGFDADEATACLYFDIKSDAETAITVTSVEVNDQKSGYVETLNIYGDELHNYEFDHFEVAEDFSWAKAVHVCANCGEEVAYDAEITYEVKVEPTCTEDGSAEYTVTYGDESEVIPVDLPAVGHEWDGLTCKRCGEVNMPFTDVPSDAFFYEPVIWAVENGITYGYGSSDTFAPDVICNRGQVVTFLWRAAGEPEPVSNVNPFTDIEESDFFYKAVLWAVEEGITAGYGSSTTFNPEGNCTRGQVATFLWRYFGEPQPTSMENPFDDVDSDEFYYTAVLWAAESGITAGYGNANTFAPDLACNRGQIVSFLYRAMN